MTAEENNLKSGQGVVCQVVAAEPGGYRVSVLPDLLEGFLPSQEELEIGETIPATFVCMHENRALMSFAYMIGTTARVQAGLPSESETAFAVWADSHPRSFKVRRAMDMIMPPLDGSRSELVRVGEEKLAEFVEGLEQSGFTGCVKVFSEEKLSRSSLLLYRGRAVVCIYGKKQKADFWPTEAALQLMLADLSLTSTQVQKYTLPDEIILPMSALFLGYPVERKLEDDAAAHLEYLLPWIEQKKQTAAFACALPSLPALCLSFIECGRFVGSFYVEEQSFVKDIEFVRDLLRKFSDARLDGFILPPEMTSESIRFGYSLTVTLSRYLLATRKNLPRSF